MSERRKAEAPEGTLEQVWLSFKSHRALDHVGDPIEQDLSACARVGDSLFVSCDETAGVDRLVPTGGSGKAEKAGKGGSSRWVHDGHFNLGDFFDLPDGAEGEMDIEGLEIDAGLLWIVGSHSLKRGKPDDGDGPVKGLKELGEIKRDPNRYFLGCLPLEETGEGRFEPAARANGREARSVRLKKKSSRLHGWLAEDGILAPFLDLPSKENGLDIEGLAVRGDRVWLGLRGPSIRGHALLVELKLKVTGKGRLKARRIDGDRRFRLYALPSDGLGIRDLLLNGDDLLILLGPTMSSDGPARIRRWRNATRSARSGLIAPDRAPVVAELPYRGAVDHPEGLALWPDAGADAVIVVYDAPSKERLKPGTQDVLADIMRLP